MTVGITKDFRRLVNLPRPQPTRRPTTKQSLTDRPGSGFNVPSRETDTSNTCARAIGSGRPTASLSPTLRTPADCGDQGAMCRPPFSDGVSGSDQAEEGGDEYQENDYPHAPSDYKKTLVGAFLLRCHFQCLRNVQLSANSMCFGSGSTGKVNLSRNTHSVTPDGRFPAFCVTAPSLSAWGFRKPRNFHRRSLNTKKGFLKISGDVPSRFKPCTRPSEAR